MTVEEQLITDQLNPEPTMESRLTYLVQWLNNIESWVRGLPNGVTKWDVLQEIEQRGDLDKIEKLGSKWVIKED